MKKSKTIKLKYCSKNEKFLWHDDAQIEHGWEKNQWAKDMSKEISLSEHAVSTQKTFIKV